MPFYSNAVFRFGLTPDVAARYTLLQNVRLRSVRMRLANGARDRWRLERLAIGFLPVNLSSYANPALSDCSLTSLVLLLLHM